jgi:hypothetical protein
MTRREFQVPLCFDIENDHVVMPEDKNEEISINLNKKEIKSGLFCVSEAFLRHHGLDHLFYICRKFRKSLFLSYLLYSWQVKTKLRGSAVREYISLLHVISLRQIMCDRSRTMKQFFYVLLTFLFSLHHGYSLIVS